jgi:molybdopterin converting factor small subunit
MNIEVHLHTILQIPSPGGPISLLQVDLNEGGLISDLANQLKLEYPLDNLLIAVNHRTAGPSTQLKDGDIVDLMPPMSGGLH